MKRKAIKLQVLLALTPVIFVLYLYQKSSRFTSSENQSYEETLRTILATNASLNQDVLKIRFRYLDNYDSLPEKIDALENLTSALEKIPPLFDRPEDRAYLQEKLSLLDRGHKERQQLLEDFKSQNAVLNISLRYFPMAGNRLYEEIREGEYSDEFALLIYDLLHSVKTYSLYPEAEAVEVIKEHISQFRNWIEKNPSHSLNRSAKSLAAHADSIILRKPKVDNLMEDLLNLPTEQHIEDLLEFYNRLFIKGLKQNNQQRIVLQVVCAGLLFSIAAAIVALVRTNRSLDSRVRERTDELKAKIQQLRDEIEERRRISLERDRLNDALLKSSRMVGMAEVASNVLHNVGNVLNSVNVSANIVRQQVFDSRSSSLSRVCQLLEQHQTNLGEFISSDPQGQQVPKFLKALNQQLGSEKENIVEELEHLAANVEHVKEIVSTQQSLCKVSGIVVEADIRAVCEEGIKLSDFSFGKQRIELVKEYPSDVPTLNLDKHKVLQIVVNLFRNAKHACIDSGKPEPRILLRVCRDDSFVAISVSDNGVGIAAENRDQIFNHGFTTKDEGHGFGLHSAANAANEMGGSLGFESEGAGRGATFTLRLPIGATAVA